MKVTTKEQAAEIYLRAATYIRRYGWQKEGMGEDGQPRCSMGALASAYPKTNWDNGLSSLMYKALYKKLDGMTLTQFNFTSNEGSKVAHLYEKVATELKHSK